MAEESSDKWGGGEGIKALKNAVDQGRVLLLKTYGSSTNFSLLWLDMQVALSLF